MRRSLGYGLVLLLGAAVSVSVLALAVGVEADPSHAPGTAGAHAAPAIAPPPASPFDIVPGAPEPAPPSLESLTPATPGAARALAVLAHVKATLQRTRYQHDTRIREREGVYLWDCSAMAAWVLQRAAPRAMRLVHGERPVARDFYRAIERAPTAHGRRGLRRIERLEDARPGDVFAWLRPPDWPPRNTGHVGFVLAPPRPIRGLPGAFTVRIADATSIPHQNDTRSYEGEGGFGEGTIMFMTDADGVGSHYGWHGTRAPFTAPTRILIGRL